MATPLRNTSCNILSIDGGGVRGIVPLTVLKRLENEVGPLTDIFQYAAGTSTGSIIATGLTCPAADRRPKFTAVQMFDNFKDSVGSVFQRTYFQAFSSAFGLRTALYQPTGLEKVLQDTLGDALLREALVPLVIPSTLLKRESSYLFTSYNPSNRDLMMRQAVRASAAAPTYFPSYTIKLGGVDYDFADGGIWANNPSLCAYFEAKKQIPSTQPIFVVLLGTGAPQNSIPESEKNGGDIFWAKNILPVIFSAGASSTDSYMRQLCPGTPTEVKSCNYWRFEIIIEEKHAALDNASPENINYLIDTTERILDEPTKKEEFETLCHYLRAQRRTS